MLNSGIVLGPLLNSILIKMARYIWLSFVTRGRYLIYSMATQDRPQVAGSANDRT